MNERQQAEHRLQEADEERSHHGAIQVTSQPGHGSAFRVLFPASTERSAKGSTETTTAKGSTETTAKGSTETKESMSTPGTEPTHGSGSILVVDDEETIRLVAKAVLERFGFDVKTAVDGKHALEIFGPQGDEFSAVLLDLTMPRLDGHETFSEMRRIRPDVKVILMSGYNERDLAHRLPMDDLAGFLKKPFRVTDLAKKVVEVLAQSPLHPTSVR